VALARLDGADEQDKAGRLQAIGQQDAGSPTGWIETKSHNPRLGRVVARGRAVVLDVATDAPRIHQDPVGQRECGLPISAELSHVVLGEEFRELKRNDIVAHHPE
jgi:hypothetical protein